MDGSTLPGTGARALALTGTLATLVNEARSPEALLLGAVDAIATTCGWPQGEAWCPDDTGRLARAPGSFAATPEAGAFNSGSVEHRFRRGEGLPGLAWARDAVVTFHPLAAIPGYTRAALAAAAGFGSAIAMPVTSGGRLECVLVFHVAGGAPGAAEAELLVLAGRQLGGTLTRLAREATAASDERLPYGTIADAAGVVLVEWRVGDEAVLASPAARALLELGDDAPLPTRPALLAMLEPADSRMVRLLEQEALDTPGERVPLAWEATLRTARGNRRHVLARGALVRRGAGAEPLVRLALVDATAQHEARERDAASRLAASEHRYRALFDRHPAPVLVVSGTAEIVVAANAAARELYGIDDTMIGVVSKRTLLTADALPGYAQWRGRTLAGRDVRRTRHRTGDGREIDVLVTSEPIEHAGAPARIAVVQDVTERLAVERRLHESMQRFETVLDNMADGVVLQDADGRIVLWNRAAERILSLTGDQLLGKTSIDPHWAALGEDGARIPGEDHPAMIARREARPVQGTMEISAGDGRRTWVAISAAPLLDADGLVTGSVSTFTDVTAARAAQRALAESERRYRLLAEQMHDMVCRHDRDGRFAWVSPSSAALLGWRPEELEGRHPREFIHEDDLARFAALGTTGPCSGDSVRAADTFRFRRADGQYAWLEVASTPAVEEGRVTGRITAARDVTERRHLEQQLAHVAKMDAVGTLAGGVAHDLNNVLTIVVGCLESLDMQLTPGETVARAEVGALREATARATALVRQLLTFARRNVEQVATVALDDVVRRAAPLLRRLLRGEQALEIACEAPGRCVALDVPELELALMNLVSNARAAMPDGGRVAIATGLVTLDAEGAARVPGLRTGTWLRLTVRDTGAGMTPEVRDRVFEPFFTTKPEGEGTGIGLATVYGVVQRAGGAIVVDSAPGAGTTFTIWLPVVERTGTAPAGAAAGTPSPVPAAPDRDVTPITRPRRATGLGSVLLVDDDAGVRGVATRLLRRAGWEVLAVDSAESAVEQLDALEGDVDVVLTDFAMPGMSGRALIEHVALRWPSVRTVLMSGYTDDEVTRTALQRSATIFVAKPFDAPTLLSALRAGLPARGADGAERADEA